MRSSHLGCAGVALLVALLNACSGEGLIEPGEGTLSGDDGEIGSLSVNPVGITAVELLGDPLLLDMLEGLSDQRRASAITTAIVATRESLTEEDMDAARRHLEDAFQALDRYENAQNVDDDDVIHLDASEQFLDAVEAMIDLGGSTRDRPRTRERNDKKA